MKRVMLVCGTVGLLVSAGAAVAATGQSLDVRTGLWEMSMVTETSGKSPMSDEDMQKLTPHQRAAIEKAMAVNQGPRTRVIKSCVTQAKLDRDDVFNSVGAGMTCSKKNIRRTRTSLSGSITCTKGARRVSEELSYQVSDREHVTGTFEIIRGEGTNTLSVKGRISGHWLSAACGAVK
jgi:hypothetical protein